MSSTSRDLISLALQRSFSTKSKKHDSLDDHIVANARGILSEKIDYTLTAKYSTTTFSDDIKNRYFIANPSKLKKKSKKKKKKERESDCLDSQMKNTELSGQNLSLPTPKHVIFSSDAVQLGWKNAVPVGSGFVNLGTTCYINSTLQALFHVPSFVNWLLDDRKHRITCEKRNGAHHTECMVCAMLSTLILSHRHTGSSTRPRLIIEKIKSICKHLSPFRQEDAHEFLRYLIEAMEKSYITTSLIPIKKLDGYSKETTPLNQIFGGYIRTEVTCLECSQTSTTFQHFQDLILDIRQTATSTVYDALESYFSKERLDGDESYHCEYCKRKVSANKKFSIEKAPNALCIQLKRFNINNYYGGSKISKNIGISQTIDLSKFKHKKGSSNGVILKYRLVSMVFHHGPSANSGHYTALGCTSSGSYYYFNDEQVFPTHFMSYSNTSNVYIIFYELEKPLNTPSISTIKTSSSTCTVTSVSNGYTNGTIQRNGFFTKRETSFTTFSNHSKQPSWELQTCENKSSSVKVNNASTTKTSTSLVPYMSSDSDSSDSENEHVNKNANSQLDENDRGSTLSPLAKKNYTLTSLLISTPKNEGSSRVTSPTRGTVNGNTGHLDTFDSENKEKCLEKPEKRNTVAFSFFNRDKKKDVKTNGDIVEDGNKKKPTVGVATPYCASRRDEHEEKGREENYIGNGLSNGFAKSSVNGSVVNGWIITDVDEECKIDESCDDKTSNVGCPVKNEWTVTEKDKHSSATKDYKNDIQENGKKYVNGNNESKNDESEQKSTISNGFPNSSYSSFNGYGGKVLTWDGEVSYINKEAEKERKEASKRPYNEDYDDEMDRGKVKKPKYHNRSDNASNLPRKNLIQQYHNNFHRKRSGWSHNHYGNNRRYNGYYKNNYNYNNRTTSYIHQNWRR